MVPICEDVYADPATTPLEQATFERDFRNAQRGLSAAFGSLTSETPVTILCTTPACVADFAGPSGRARVVGPGQRVPGGTYVSGDRPTIVLTGLGAGAGAILLHEMVHVEMHSRVGNALPEWFSEGLAFSLASQRESPPFLTACDRSPKAIDDLRRLDVGWGQYTDLHFQEKMVAAYCQAGAEADAWLHRHGMQGLRGLIDTVRGGGAFYASYGPMLTQTSDAPSPDDTSYDHGILLHNAAFEATLAGDQDSFARTFGYVDLANRGKPFSIGMWIKPRANAGTLVHVSSNPDGTGWCTPFVGYDGSGQLVSQVLRGRGPDPTAFAVAVSASPPALDEWTQIMMTWAPGSANRLYVNGVKSAEAPAPTYDASPLGSAMYITWGSSNANGTHCWQGAIRPGGFKGSIRGVSVYDKELTAEEIAAIVRPPSRPAMSSSR
jgi:concanavalin A-like lectin/glucanase superfamily protein